MRTKEARIQVNLRIKKDLKERLHKMANEMDISMRQVIEHGIENIPLIDNKMRKERFIAIHALCKEINYIGKNINQLTIAIRQIKSDRKIEDGEFAMLVRELEKYNQKRNEISDLLGKYLF